MVVLDRNKQRFESFFLPDMGLPDAGASGRQPRAVCIPCRKALSVKVFAGGMAGERLREHFYREFDPGSG